MNSCEDIPVEEGQVTRLLRSWHDGDATAQQQLMEVVYAQLRRMAARSMQSQDPNHTLRPTELVHEAWLKLNGGQGNFIDRSHFMGVAAKAMRSILIDYARAKGSQKRFGSLKRVPLEAAISNVMVEDEADLEQLIDLHNALNRLAEMDPSKGHMMELVYFGGLNAEEAATVLDIHVRTAQREIQFSRLWLKAAMKL